MRNITVLITSIMHLCFIMIFINNLYASSGEEKFKSLCAVCHTIGKGDLVGPDLQGAVNKHTEDWLLKYIKSSQTVIKGGDEIANALFKKYNQIIMPDQNLTDDEIKGILAYIEEQSPETSVSVGDAATEQVVPVKPKKEFVVTEGAITEGRKLFEGRIRLKNNGPTCNSCHHVKNDAVIGGGILAKDLTTVFSRLNEPGVTAILGSPPFPVMKEAYKDNPLTQEEISKLVAFLEYADKEHFFQHPKDYGTGLFYSGILGASILLSIYYFIWFNRKKRSVNHAIYKRQVKTHDMYTNY